MRYPATCAVLAVVLVVAGGFVSPVAAAAVSGGGDALPESSTDGPPGTGDAVGALGAAPETLAVQEFSEPVVTEFHVALRADRDAAWTVTVRYELADANETAAFERVAERFSDGDAGPSADLYRNLAAGASTYAGREMEIVDVSRTVRIDDDPVVDDPTVEAVGELELSFVWTSFLEDDGDHLVMSDAFMTAEGGTWLGSLERTQRMVIQTPDGYAVSSTPGVSVDFEENAVVIEGPQTFDADERIGVVYSSTAGPPGPPWALLAGAVVLAAAFIAIGLFAYRRYDDHPNGGSHPGEERAVTSGGVDGADGAGHASGAFAGRGDGPAAEGSTAGGSAAGAGTANDANPKEDLSLLSDEERVERLLDLEGGRMRQADIVNETGWSDAKVSQLLSAMAEDGRVEKLRLGRENLISLPDGDEGADDSDAA